MLIGSGPYEEKYAADIMTARLDRMSKAERGELLSLLEILNNPAATDANMAMARFGELMARADAYDPLPHKNELLEYQSDINRSVWQQASELRISGNLLKLGKRIRCPVLAIHGDYDLHPAEGVRVPLARVLKDFRFVLLEKCGHEPWLERFARDRFYEVLKKELE